MCFLQLCPNGWTNNDEPINIVAAFGSNRLSPQIENNLFPAPPKNELRNLLRQIAGNERDKEPNQSNNIPRA